MKSSLLFFLDKLVEGIGDFEAGPGGTVMTRLSVMPIGCAIMTRRD